MKPRRLASGLACATLFLAAGLQAQLPSATVLRRLEKTGSYSVQIGNDTMTAVPDSLLKNILIMKKDLETQRAINSHLEEMIAAHEKVVGQADRLSAVQRQLIAVQDSESGALRKQVELLQRMKQGGWLSFELGAGASGSDTEPGVVAGVAVRRLRIWSLLQKSNSGAFLGVNFPVF